MRGYEILHSMPHCMHVYVFIGGVHVVLLACLVLGKAGRSISAMYSYYV
jgi:hypothetical protein